MAKRKSKRRGQQSPESQGASPAESAPAEVHAPSGGAKGGRGSRAIAGRRRSLPNWPVLAPALVGMALTVYLSVTAWLGQAPALCTEGSGCEVVQTSQWGTLLGLPTAAWGFLGYAFIGYVAFRVKDASRHWQFAFIAAAVGFAVSVYLTYISVQVLGATCFYCLGSLALMTVILAIVTLQRPEGMVGFSWPVWAGQSALIALIVVGGLHLHYQGVFDETLGPEDPYLRGLAEHLSSTGAVFYGAFW